jgi:hypothetical protein
LFIEREKLYWRKLGVEFKLGVHLGSHTHHQENGLEASTLHLGFPHLGLKV